MTRTTFTPKRCVDDVEALWIDIDLGRDNRVALAILGRNGLDNEPLKALAAIGKPQENAPGHKADTARLASYMCAGFFTRHGFLIETPDQL
jgi:hypothetical protein